jgi:hypothetical protein
MALPCLSLLLVQLWGRDIVPCTILNGRCLQGLQGDKSDWVDVESDIEPDEVCAFYRCTSPWS